MTQIDKESSKFIKWARQKMSEPHFYTYAVGQTMRDAKDFYERKPEVIERLFDKLYRGAEEHGAPLYRQEETKRERELEYLDGIGWLLVEWYNREKQNAENQKKPDSGP